MDKRTFAALCLAGVVLYVIVGLLVTSGCTSYDPALFKVERLEARVATVERKVATSQTATAGRDVEQRSQVNEPWTGRILAVGFSAIPASFLLYLLAHRFPTLRKGLDALKGKNGHQP